MSKSGTRVERTIHYTYPSDCGRFILFPEGKKPECKPVDVLRYECGWSSQWSSGGCLVVSDAVSGETDDDDEENYNTCKLSLNLYNKNQWHVYYTDLDGGGYTAKLLGLFDHYEGDEIFTRILADSNNGGSGIYHHGERVSIDVTYENEDEDDVGFATYLWIISDRPPFEFTHSLNCFDDWDQSCYTDMDIKIPSSPPKILTTKKKKKSMNEKKKPKKSSKG